MFERIHKMYTLGILGVVNNECNLKDKYVKATFAILCIDVLLLNVFDYLYYIMQYYVSKEKLLKEPCPDCKYCLNKKLHCKIIQCSFLSYSILVVYTQTIL